MDGAIYFEMATQEFTPFSFCITHLHKQNKVLLMGIILVFWNQWIDRIVNDALKAFTL